MNYDEINDYEVLSMVADNEDATELLFKKYKPLIVGLAKKIYNNNQNTGFDLNDLIQEGMIGFSTAINTFDENKDTTFFTYAKTCIERRLISLIKSASRLKHQILNQLCQTYFQKYHQVFSCKNHQQIKILCYRHLKHT